jgi:hypothetical protein
VLQKMNNEITEQQLFIALSSSSQTHNLTNTKF